MNPSPLGNVVSPEAFEYLGAFRLPGREDRPQTFAYGGNAMTFNPDGDPSGASDGFPGSLFVMGHERIAYGEVPDGNQVAKVDIPVPINSRDMEDLNTAEFILYDPVDLAKVAAGQLESWQPQPYATIDIDEDLYLNPPEWDLVEVGWGDQRRYRIGDVSFDRANGLLYILELYADGARPVVHVWKINPR